MPELPEVETVCRGLSEKLLNRIVKNVNVIHFDLRYRISSSLRKKLINTQIKAIIRRGKNGLIVLNSRDVLHFHLGMTGKFKMKNINYIPKKHDHLVIEFDNQIKLIYNDVRKFGYIKLKKKPFDIINFNKVGYEPFLTSNFKEDLYYKIKNKKTTIKDILLDQTYICGIGNIYASEILFKSKISPFKIGENFDQNAFFDLLKAIKYILNLAIKKGGSSIKDYANANSQLGYFQTKFKVYDREGLPCCKCKSLIFKIKQKGRSTFFCRQCQS